MTASPGWYPSGERERYWDGERWTDAYRQPPTPNTANKSKWALGITIAGVFLLAGGCIAVVAIGSGPREYSDQEIAEGVIEVCQSDVRDSLRDPDSARFTDWKAWKVNSSTLAHGSGDKLYSAAGLVNAKNGFGGFAGNTPYTCDAVVTDDGDVRAQATDASDLLETP